MTFAFVKKNGLKRPVFIQRSWGLIRPKRLQKRHAKINCTTRGVIALRIRRHIVTVDDYSLFYK